MENLIKTTLIGLFFGTFGTTIGGIIGISFKKTSNKFLSFVLAFASGLMLAIVCFDLIPEAMEISSIFNVIIGIVLGIIVMIFCDSMVKRKFSTKLIKSQSNLLRTGIIVSIRISTAQFSRGFGNRLRVWCIYNFRFFACNCNMSA